MTIEMADCCFTCNYRSRYGYGRNRTSCRRNGTFRGSVPVWGICHLYTPMNDSKIRGQLRRVLREHPVEGDENGN